MSGDDYKPGSFEERLKAAQARQELDAAPKPGASAGVGAMGIGLRVGVELVAALAVSLAIGFGLDRWLGTAPLFLVVFILLGGAAGVLNVWRLMMPSKKG